MEKDIQMTGIYILAEQVKINVTDPIKPKPSILSRDMPVPEDKSLRCGRVIRKGPGFLMPNNQNLANEVDSLISGSEGTVKALFVPLDIDEGIYSGIIGMRPRT
jgi:hypothetical protein